MIYIKSTVGIWYLIKYLDKTKIGEEGAKLITCGHVGFGGERGIIFSANGIAPCLPASQWKDAVKIAYERRCDADCGVGVNDRKVDETI